MTTKSPPQRPPPPRPPRKPRPKRRPKPRPKRPAGAKLAIAADPDGALKFTETELTADAGQVEIDFSNPSQVPHAVDIEGMDGGATETVTGTDAPPITVDLKPGEYTFYCPVGDHRKQGMEGKLTVR